jgi:hypothetical protein
LGERDFYLSRGDAIDIVDDMAAEDQLVNFLTEGLLSSRSLVHEMAHSEAFGRCQPVDLNTCSPVTHAKTIQGILDPLNVMTSPYVPKQLSKRCRIPVPRFNSGPRKNIDTAKE